jgi:hypothetical protein
MPNLFLKLLISGMSSLMISLVPVHALEICKGKRSRNVKNLKSIRAKKIEGGSMFVE